MSINCEICSELFASNADVYVTRCGHLFHFHCLVNWFERSKTCPHCRSEANEENIHRVFFNFFDSGNMQDDAATLKSKLDNLNFQMTLKEKDIKIHEEKYNRLESQNVELRREIQQLEENERSHRSEILAMKEQKTEAETDRDKLAEENVQLRNQLKEQENVNLALTGTSEEVNDMLRNEKSIESLELLAATLKKYLVKIEQRKQELEHNNKLEVSSCKGQMDNLKTDNDSDGLEGTVK